jgi:hypothetical protein
MIFKVEKWNREFDENGEYEDTWTSIGIHEVVSSGDYNNKIFIVGGQVVETVFKVDVSKEYITISGFVDDRSGKKKYVEYRMSVIKGHCGYCYDGPPMEANLDDEDSYSCDNPCLCVKECDCQDEENGFVSEECPEHNLIPLPNPNCPIHGR